MKRIKIVAIPLAIMSALILAWTIHRPPPGSENPSASSKNPSASSKSPSPSSKNFDCTSVQNYYYDGVGYIPVGQFGVDYYCVDGTGSVCTYYQVSPGVFAACRLGSYTPIRH